MIMLVMMCFIIFIEFALGEIIDYIRNMDRKRIIILRNNVSPILSTVRQFVATLFVVLQLLFLSFW